MHQNLSRTVVCAAVTLSCAFAAQAATFSDTSIGYRYGTDFSEPRNPNHISKDILNLNHVSGYKYGTNFFNVDMLLSDSKDPAGAGSTNGAQEVYVVYRNTVDLEKLTGSPYQFGLVKGVGVTGGFDFNTKTDTGYNSKKRMLVVGPTLMLDVPGFLNVSLLALFESNAPYNTVFKTSVARYTYDSHAMLSASWGIPLGKTGLSFEGYANFIETKGKNEFGADTAAETNVDMQVMYDVSPLIGAAPKSLKVGLEYQYWHNKFGNDSSGVSGPGAAANTPMVRAEYHF
jgi:nucleoside-specific outer membrane channel protein Tsx